MDSSLAALVFDATEVDPLGLDDDAMLADIVALTDKSSDTGSESPPAKRKRVRKRHGDELKYLRVKMDEYTSQLSALKQLKAVESLNSSPWEGISRRQAQARSAAEAENAKLKMAVEEQLKVTEALMRIVAKRPKLTEAPYIEDWKVQKLTDGPDRKRAMHALVDAKRDALEGVFVRKQIQDATDVAMHSDVLYDATNDSVRLEAAAVHDIQLDFATAVDTVWAMYYITAPRDFETSTYRCIEVLDDDTIYYRRSCSLGHQPVESNVLMKRYVEPTRTIFISETVLEDTVSPYSPNVYISNDTTWMTMEKLSTGATRVRYCASAVLPCKAKRQDVSAPEPTPEAPKMHYVAFAELLLNAFRNNLRDMQTYVREQVEAKLGSQPTHTCPIQAIRTKFLGKWY
ncbi:hypothetical protein ACHHYP_20433 [Achlya hypogyna]|uniref:M96 mating-specific protein family n=1 Tax=Achlya hypogyna TaxID=1202772 RepID=A0A1V9YMT4_ACHHY|nr:hypothetical protein ACHHYP_20433 [Achlya hypogyna]